MPIYTKWFAEYGTSNGGVQFHYLPRGSAEGISNASSGSIDFGGSEVPMNDEELAKAPTKPLLLPSVVGVSRLSWKWRKRSSVKITERTYEKRAQALHC